MRYEHGESVAQEILAAVLFALAVVILGFLFYFLIPSLKLWIELRRINRLLAQLKTQAEQARQVVDPQVITRNIMQTEPFRHLWGEYSETLHAQYSIVDGQQKIIAQRSTAPAEMFFSPEVLVHVPLRTDFFKHLPGIFTGLGIIGTFNGLIKGLKNFDVSQAQDNLTSLVHSVSSAFFISAVAISLAMLVTFLERITVTLRCKQVEQLCQLIDSLYASGVGEEYLARLVKASEESATQTTQLKDSLVADLKEMMTNLADRQIEATQNSHRVLAANITESITSSLRDPMEGLFRVVDRASQNQGDNVQRALSDVISGFMAKVEETFGGQMTGLNALMQETTASMRETRDRFAELVESLGNAEKSAGAAMTEQLARAMEQAEQRQRDMNGLMRQFVEQIRELVSQSQAETSGKLHEALEALSHKMTTIMDNLSDQQARISQESSRQQEVIAGNAQTTMTNVGSQVTALSAQTSQAVQVMKESITAIRNITTESVEKMNGAAETLYVAASN